MRKVIAENGGTADDFLGGFNDANGLKADWPVDDVRWPLAGEVTVYAKTGTAQHGISTASDHGAFVCYAPADSTPKIAIAIYGEKAAHGNTLATIARAMLDVKFEVGEIGDVPTYENQLS